MAKPILTVLFILFFVSTAVASDCNEAKDTVSMNKCYEQKYENADQELNAIYNEAMRALPDAEKQKLKEAQKAWLKYRDASFEFYLEKNKDMRSYGSIAVGDYKATLVEKRVQELKYLLSGPEEPPVRW